MHKIGRWVPGLMLLILFAVMSCLELSQCYASEAETAQTEENNRQLRATPDLKLLLQCVVNPGDVDDSEKCDIDAIPVNQSLPSWPIYAFLTGELHRTRGQAEKALQAYRSLVSWAHADPFKDGWGGSPLVGVALWRWTRIVAAMPDPDYGEAKILFSLADKFRNKRMIRCLFSRFLSISNILPQIEEDLLRQQVLLAYRVGQIPTSRRLFLNYISSAGITSFSEIENKLLEDLIASNLVSVDRLNLLRGKRQLALKNFDHAGEYLNKAWASKDLQIRAEAGLHIADLLRKRGYLTTGRARVIAYLDEVVKNSTNPEIVQSALYRRSLFANREGPDRDIKQFKDDLNRLLNEFPESRLADDALLDFGSFYMNTGEYDESLKYLEKLRNFKGKNDWTKLSYFKPALVLYTRGGPGDLEKADQLLKQLYDLEQKGRSRPLRFPVLFWRGRIAADLGDETAAKDYFNEIINQRPRRKIDEYYVIRAMAHLHSGNEARKLLLPDAETRKSISRLYSGKKPIGRIEGKSLYHQRLEMAIESGLYSDVLQFMRRKREVNSSRSLVQHSIEELDENGLTTLLGLMISLRQDALAARDKNYRTTNLMQIANAVGHRANDWSLAMSLLIASRKLSTMRQYQDYLSLAYPGPFNDKVTRSAAEYHVMPELLYSVMRKESYLDPDAISTYGAIGLFQFTTPQFSILNDKWDLLQSSRMSSKEAFLRDPELSIQLGARWFKEILLKEYENNVLFAFMGHNAGVEAVQEWSETWERVGRMDDVEYIVETVRFLETRHFLRWVLTDMAILNAMGVFKVGSN